MTHDAEYFDGPHGRIAYRRHAGAASDHATSQSSPGVVWLGGFRSDMLGSKAAYLGEWAQRSSRRYLRFDYSGHGESEGKFEQGCIGDWAADAQAAFDALTDGPQILVGSSMGGWIASLLALARPERIAAIVFIAPAPDFTERLMWPSFTQDQRETLLREGRLEIPSDYSDAPDIITQRLIEDGRRHLVMTGSVPIRCPVRVFQGMCDDAVPFTHALSFAQMLESEDVTLTLSKQGDHRLSTPEDLERLSGALDHLTNAKPGQPD